MSTVLLTNQYAPALQALIRAEAPAGFDVIALEQPSHADIIARAPEADYLLVGGRIPIDLAVLNAGTRLRMVQRTGVGLDSMDLDAIESRGIPVYVNLGVNALSVAEHTLMLILAVLRRMPVVHRSLREGQWKKHELGIQNRDLNGRRVGLIGLGHIGQAVARLLQPFGVILSYYKRQCLANLDEQTLGLNYQPLEELIAEPEVLSLHCPLTPATRNLLSRERISRMRPGPVLINTARGGLVDEPALIEALQHDTSAAPDSTPSNRNRHPLRVLSVPWTMSFSALTSAALRESFQEMMRRAFQNIAAFEAGELEVIAPMRLR